MVSPHVPPDASAGAHRVRSIAVRVVGCWVGLALLVTVVNQSTGLSRPFDYRHAWISAFFSVEARSFAEHGVVNLGGVPVANNWPLGSEPEANFHWPPLFPMLIGVMFRLFGESETVAHSVMLGLLLANAVLLGTVVNDCSGRLAALVAAFGWLVAPVNVLYAHLVWNLHLAIALALLSLLAFVRATRGGSVHRGWAALGCLAYALAVSASWEPALMCPGLLGAALWRRRPSEVRLATAYVLAALVSGGVILGNAAMRYPEQIMETGHRVMFQLGVAESWVSNGWAEPRPAGRVSLADAIRLYIGRHRTLVGWLPLVATLGWLVSWRKGRAAHSQGTILIALCSLLSIWWLWFAAFWRHILVHDCEMVLAVPATAAALGWGASALLVEGGGRGGRKHIRRVIGLTALGIAPALLLVPPIATLRESLDRLPAARAFGIPARTGPSEMGSPGDSEVQLAREVFRYTPAGAVVVTPLESPVLLYYSKRYLIQGIDTDEILESVRERMLQKFRASPIYLAVPAERRDDFPLALRKYEHVVDTDALMLVRLFAGTGS